MSHEQSGTAQHRGCWTLTLNDPDRRNAIDAEMRDALGDAIAEVAADRHARTLVVTGAGTAFCAGADLPAMFGEPGRGVAEIRADLHRVYDSFLRVRALPIPTIAAVQGPAVGAGLNLALACDTRIVGPKAKLIASFTKLGLHPGGGCTWFLTRALGLERALRLLLDGGSVDGPGRYASGSPRRSPTTRWRPRTSGPNGGRRWTRRWPATSRRRYAPRRRPASRPP
ncbi:enoyl-CoA hydratase-related protein [Micromonospora sp. BRA006-A]|nr:enoyl-CoA hydratase-related protein [Micromonospora sp. BRA006-A]